MEKAQTVKGNLVLPLHHDEQALVVVVRVLVNVDYTHDVFATTRPPVQLHLSARLDAVQQDLELEEKSQGNPRHRRPRITLSAYFSLLALE